MKILSGITLVMAGRCKLTAKRFTSLTSAEPGQAYWHYISGVALAPDLTVAENIFLDDLGMGNRVINWSSLNKKRLGVKQPGLCIKPEDRVGDLSVAYQQMV
jgi:ribose transport system ATP-binding protein